MKSTSRRQFIANSSKAGIGLILGGALSPKTSFYKTGKKNHYK